VKVPVSVCQRWFLLFLFGKIYGNECYIFIKPGHNPLLPDGSLLNLVISEFSVSFVGNSNTGTQEHSNTIKQYNAITQKQQQQHDYIPFLDVQQFDRTKRLIQQIHILTMIHSRLGKAYENSTHCRDPVKPQKMHSSNHQNGGGLAEFVASKTRNLFLAGGKRPAVVAHNSDASLRSDRSTSTERTAATCTSTSSATTNFTMSKKVHFANKVVVRKIPTLAQYSQEEKNDSWFTEEEYTRISNDCIKQIRKLESGTEFRGKKYCSRGIEHHTRLGSIARLKNRSTSIHAVLDEQDRQQREGEHYNDMKISAAYHRCTSSSQLWANTVALRDQREAEAANFDDELDIFVMDRPTISALSESPPSAECAQEEQQSTKTVTGDSWSHGPGLVAGLSRTRKAYHALQA
jgi:hypothetical protein